MENYISLKFQISDLGSLLLGCFKNHIYLFSQHLIEDTL